MNVVSIIAVPKPFLFLFTSVIEVRPSKWRQNHPVKFTSTLCQAGRQLKRLLLKSSQPGIDYTEIDDGCTFNYNALQT